METGTVQATSAHTHQKNITRKIAETCSDRLRIVNPEPLVISGHKSKRRIYQLDLQPRLEMLRKWVYDLVRSRSAVYASTHTTERAEDAC